MPETMKNIVDSIESLKKNATDYGKTSLNLIKLKAINKTSDVISSLIPRLIVLLILTIFLLFLSLGVALYLGEILENIIYGFFVVAAFYGIIGLIVHLFMHNRIKRGIFDYIIKLALK
ncbi:MAG: hypothetical protein PHD00_06405 [Bacteroidales bacterium]|nr:hypothetical protein [Bacteroidales bacterium]MDD4673493.1 hypothetical protein [Bacteroidales bacterium]MDY0349433.1 hypothetical protein [Tenuifilaceae bacterium]